MKFYLTTKPISTFCVCLLFILSSLFVSILVINEAVEGSTQSASAPIETSPSNRLLVIAAIDSRTSSDKLTRLNQSAEALGLPIEFLQLHQASPEGKTLEEKKFDQLLSLIDKHTFAREDDHLVILVLRSLDLLLNGDKNEILNAFNAAKKEAKILFSASAYDWPNPGQSWSSQNKSRPDEVNKPYLSSRAFIGHAPKIVELLQVIVEQKKAEQPFSFHDLAKEIYANESLREKLSLGLDKKCELFASLSPLHTSWDTELELEFEENKVNVKSLASQTKPVIVHAGGSGRTALNSLGNYLGLAWTPAGGCRHCNASKISLTKIKDADLPRVLVGIFIEEPTPFMEQFYESLKQLDYPSKQVHLFIHNSIEHHSAGLRWFLESEGHKYASVELSDSTATTTTTKDKDSSQTLLSNVIGGGGGGGGGGGDGDGSPDLIGSSIMHNNDNLTEWEARDYGLFKCKQISCDYYLSLDSVARLDRPEALRELIETNRTLVAPMLTRPRKLWSNFWASISDEGFYQRSQDYVDLVTRERVGVWNVPLVMDCYLIEGKFLRHWLDRRPPQAPSAMTNNDNNNNIIKKSLKLTHFDERYPQIKPALIFSRNLRQTNGLDELTLEEDQIRSRSRSSDDDDGANEKWALPPVVMQYLTNEQEFGHLVDTSHFNLTRKYPEFYELEWNMLDWQQVYMHDKYFDLFDEFDEIENHPKRIRLESPCQDVYWFPLVNDRFCDQLIDMMEEFGQWSAGKNDDPRIEGGYESVPTRDIHFRQVGLHQMWLGFLRQFVMPVQMKEYIGYEHDPPRTDLAFVVRYHPAEQPSLRPHHDSSTYTLNIALNAPGKDYEGGGCRFVRYNCSVTESRRGWALIHPGRLTHYHEGLPVTKGTRYIMVTFIDP